VQLELGSILLLMNDKAQGGIVPILECKCIEKFYMNTVRNWVGNESKKKLPSSTWGEMLANTQQLTKTTSSDEDDMLNEVLKFEAKMPAKMHQVEEEDASFLLTDNPMDLSNVLAEDVEVWANLLPDLATSRLVALTEAMVHLRDHRNAIHAFMESTGLDLEVHDHQIKHIQRQVGVPKPPSLLGSSLWGAVENTVSMVDELATVVDDSGVNVSGMMETAMWDEIAKSVILV